MKLKFLQTSSALAVLSVGLAIPAAAVAQTNTTKATNLEEIVVTAQKREENVQDAPLAISAITGATLAKDRVL